jgi:hypothetical protein
LDDDCKGIDEQRSPERPRQFSRFSHFPRPWMARRRAGRGANATKHTPGPGLTAKCCQRFQIHLSVFRMLVKMPDC